MEIIQVSATSPASAVAQAISSVIHEYQCAEVQAVGAEAFLRARQALSLAAGYLRHEGFGVVCVPERKKVIADNHRVTLIKVMVKVTTTASPSARFFFETPINKARRLPRV
jgi:stage V sporulation protein SpoVS